MAADRAASNSEDDDANDGRMSDEPDAPHPAFASYATEPVPQAAVGVPGKDGALELTFAPTSSGTALIHDYATVPFHVSGTLGHDPHPDAETVFIQSPTGGVAQGDRHDVTITVEPDAVAHVSTGSATKVQSMGSNYAAADRMVSVGAGGHLDYVPEPTILHADARYHQELTLNIAPSATAVLCDVVVSGRLARGECFAFERYLSQVRVEEANGLLFEDATHLTPAGSDPGIPGVLGDFTVYGTVFVVAHDQDTTALSDSLHEVVTTADSEARAGATELPNGVGIAVRALSGWTEPVEATLHAAWDHARQALLDAPAPTERKY